MSQSRKMSLGETITQVTLGYAVAVVSQLVIYPRYDMDVSFTDQLEIAGWFVLISICRSYSIRRLFNKL